MSLQEVTPVVLTELETGLRVKHMLMAAIATASSDPTVLSMNDATNWVMPKNEREFRLSPHREILHQLKLKKMSLYNELETCTLVLKTADMQVLDVMWIYGKKNAPNVDPPCQPTVRCVVKSGPMDKDLYNAHEDTVRMSTIEVQLAITAVYRLLLEVIDLEQAFQATKVAEGSPPVYMKQFPGFERVPVGAPPDSSWQQYVNQLNVTFQGTINGSSGLGSAVNIILTKEVGMTRLLLDCKGYMIYNGPAAKTLDENIVLRDSGKLDGETSTGLPFGFAMLTVHVDDFPLSSTGARLTKFIKAIIGGYYKTTSTPGHRTLGRNLEIGNGYIRSDCNDYWMRLATDHDRTASCSPRRNIWATQICALSRQTDWLHQ